MDSGLVSPLVSPPHSPVSSPLPTETDYVDLLAAKELDLAFTQHKLSQHKQHLFSLQRISLAHLSALFPSRPSFQPCYNLNDVPRLIEAIIREIQLLLTGKVQMQYREKVVSEHMHEEGKRLDSVRSEVESAIQTLVAERTALEATRAEAEELHSAVQAGLESVERERDLLETGMKRRDWVLREKGRRLQDRELQLGAQEAEVSERLQILESELRKLAVERNNLASHYSSQRTQLESDRAALQSFSSRLAEAKSTLTTQLTDLSQRENDLHSREAAVKQLETRLKDKYEQAEIHCQRLANDLKATAAYKAHLETQNSALQAQEKRLQLALSAVTDTEHLESKQVIDKLAQENLTLRRKLEQLEAEHTQKEHQFKQDKLSLENLRDLLESKAQALASYEDSLRNKENTLEAQIETLQSEKKALKSEEIRLEALEKLIKNQEKAPVSPRNDGFSVNLLETIHTEIAKTMEKVLQDRKNMQEDREKMQKLIKELEEEGKKVQKKQEKLVALNRELLTRERELLRREKELKLHSVWDDPIVRLSEGFLLEDS